ncbi:MAG: ATP-binding protein [Anaerolineae bacterium]|nr:ATP-binding protein [Anaerolineae bacterium]
MHFNVPIRKAFADFVWFRLMPAALATFLLAVTFTSFYGAKISSDRHEALAKFSARRLEREIDHLHRHLSSLAETLRGKPPREAARILNNALSEGHFESFFLIDASGAVILIMPSTSLLPSEFPTKGFSLAQSPSGYTSFYLAHETPEGVLIAAVSHYYLKSTMAREFGPFYRGQLFLASSQGHFFPLYPMELEESSLRFEPLPPLKTGHQIYMAGHNLLIRGFHPLGNSGISVIVRSSFLGILAPFLGIGFGFLALVFLIWFVIIHITYRDLERMAIAPIEVLLEGIKNLRKGLASPYFPAQLPGAAAEINQLLSSFKEVANEITATQAALARSEKEKSLVLEGVSDLVTLQDLDLRIQWANKAAGDSVGKKPEELVGRHCYEIWHGRTSPCPGCPVVEAIRTGSPQQNEITSPDGRIWFIRARPLKDEGGNIIGVVETTTEITQIRQAEEEERALAEISKALNAADVREAFPTLAKTLSRVLDCQRIVLLFFDEETRTFRITNLLSELPVPELHDGASFAAGDTAAFEVLMAGEMCATTNLEKMASFPVERALAQAGYRSRIILPLNFMGKILGALALVSTHPEPFWEGKEFFLKQVNEVLSIALARDHTFQREKEERSFTSTVAETLTLILKISSPEDLFGPILEKVERIIQADAYNLMLIIGDYAQVVSHRGYEKWGVEEKIAWYSFPISDYQGLRTVYEKGEPLIIYDTASVSWWVQLPGFEWIRSYLCAPLKIEGKVIGFLNVDGARPFQFTSKDLQRLQIFADYISLALEKVKMLTVLEEYSEQMERLVQDRTEHLQARQAWLEAIFKGSSDGYILFNPQGEILEMNLLAWAWLNQVASPEEAKSLRETLREMALRAQTYPEITRDLGSVTLHIKVIPLEPGYPGALAILHDITYLKALDKMKTKFITDISHELRTPMSALKLYGELIRTAFPEKQSIYIKQIVELIDHMATLVNDIEEVARLEAGRIELNLKPVELNPVVERILEKHRQKARKHDHRLEFFPSQDNPVVMADSHRLEQILDNLVDNAIRYTPDGGRITVSIGIREEGGRLWGAIEVADNGIGIPEEELPHIFERFFRGEGAQAKQIPGTGLGLAIAKELVDLHRGKITVKSKLGEGSTFTVMLPLLEKPFSKLEWR